MSKARVIVLSVVEQGMSKADAAKNRIRNQATRCTRRLMESSGLQCHPQDGCDDVPHSRLNLDVWNLNRDLTAEQAGYSGMDITMDALFVAELNRATDARSHASRGCVRWQ
jgi:hypothetical protein